MLMTTPTPTDSAAPSSAELDRLAHTIAEHGVAAVESQLPAVVRAASRTEVPSVVLAVLENPAEPEIARARAFDMAVRSLHRAVGTTDRASHRDRTARQRPTQPIVRAGTPSLTVV
jgi:hypothetical protein